MGARAVLISMLLALPLFCLAQIRVTPEKRKIAPSVSSAEQSPAAGHTMLADNPRSEILNASSENVFRAAKTAAAGQRIIIPQDEGIKDLTDSGQEIQSFQFATTLPGVGFRVIEEISVEPQPDGRSVLEVFFHKDRGSIPYVPSAAYQLREQQLQNQLERRLSALEQQKDNYETHYEEIHDIDLKTYVEKQKEISRQEYDAKVEEIEQEKQAKLADLAGMPTSSFSTMAKNADKFLNLVEQILDGGKTKTAVE